MLSLTTSFSFPDKTRGVFNEGGLFGERQGWHLPGFSTAGWASRDLSQGLPNNAAGVGFFISTFKLDLPTGIDALMSFTFEEPLGQPYRAILFVNGWMMGKRVANLGLAICSRFPDIHTHDLVRIQATIEVPSARGHSGLPRRKVSVRIVYRQKPKCSSTIEALLLSHFGP